MIHGHKLTASLTACSAICRLNAGLYLFSLFAITYSAIVSCLTDDPTRYMYNSALDISRGVCEVLGFGFAGAFTLFIEVNQVRKWVSIHMLNRPKNYIQRLTKRRHLNLKKVPTDHADQIPGNGNPCHDVIPANNTKVHLDIHGVYYLCHFIIYTYSSIFRHKIQYWKDPFNLVDLISSMLFVTVVPLRFFNRNEQWACFSIAYLLWTIRMFKFAAVFRYVYSVAMLAWEYA